MSVRSALLLAAASMAVGSVSQAAVVTYYIDMGPTSSASPWNNINDGNSHTLTDSTGAMTTATLISGGWSGAANNAVTYMTGAAAAAFGGPNNNAATDSAYDNSPLTPPVLTFGGLDPAATYTFTIFASRNSGGNKTGDYTVTGMNSATGSLNAETNWDNILVLRDIVPSAGKTISLSAALNPANTSGYVYLNAVRMDAVVPEPASLGVLAVGALALLRRRKA